MSENQTGERYPKSELVWISDTQCIDQKHFQYKLSNDLINVTPLTIQLCIMVSNDANNNRQGTIRNDK